MTETQKRRKKGARIEPMIPSTYVPTMVKETNAFKQLKSCYIVSGSSTFDVTSNLPFWLPFVDSPEEIVNKIDAVSKAIPEVIKHHNMNKTLEMTMLMTMGTQTQNSALRLAIVT